MLIHATTETLIFFKVSIAVLGLVIAWHVPRLVGYGHAMAYGGMPSAIESHVGTLKCISCLALLAVSIIYVYAQQVPNAVPLGLLRFHEAVVTAMLCVFAAALWFNGKRNPIMHRRLVYVVLGMFAIVFVTGSVMWYDLPTHA